MIPQIDRGEKTGRYRVPRRLIGGIVWAALVGRRRSFAHDAQWAVEGIDPEIEVHGGEHVPARGPFLVTCNHYSRPGFGAWWVALAIGAAMAARRAPDADREMRWVMTAAWTYPESAWKRRVLTPLTRWAFGRAARVYGFVPMPPMPPDPDEVEARTEAVLRTVRLARRAAREGGMIGLAPEGQDVSEGLGEPPVGAGQFLALLVRAGMPILPVGIGERSGCLQVSFGPLYEPAIPAKRSQRDAMVASQVMAAIARQMP